MIYALQHRNPPRVFPIILQNARTATQKNNFGGLLLKRKQRRRRTRIDRCGFRFSLFPGQLFFKSRKNVLSPHGGAFQFELCYAFLYT